MTRSEIIERLRQMTWQDRMDHEAAVAHIVSAASGAFRAALFRALQDEEAKP